MPTKNKTKLYLHKTEDAEPFPGQRVYDSGYRPTEEERADMPDVMDAVDSMQGANVPIQKVGVSNFRLPLAFRTREGERLVLETSVAGSVSLEAGLKGINMSRIMRAFYERREETFSLSTLEAALEDLRDKVGSYDAQLALRFNYPILQTSLRSGLEGYQYYRCGFEGRLGRDGVFTKYARFDFVYSSACPCSAELAEHARETRGVYAIPHSQRSKARLLVQVAADADLAIEDLQEHCLEALKTETQVMVKREDEQAFAELNGAYIKFVEDAARLLYERLDRDPRLVDFQIACSHLESLHSHDAVSVICKGAPGGLRADFADFDDLVC